MTFAKPTHDAETSYKFFPRELIIHYASLFQAFLFCHLLSKMPFQNLQDTLKKKPKKNPRKKPINVVNFEIKWNALE